MADEREMTAGEAYAIALRRRDAILAGEATVNRIDLDAMLRDLISTPDGAAAYVEAQEEVLCEFERAAYERGAAEMRDRAAATTARLKTDRTGGHAEGDNEALEMAAREIRALPLTKEGDQTSCEEITARCEDCDRPYGEDHGFPDFIIPLDMWQRISSAGDETGLLCPSCICGRLHRADIREVEGAFMSGPIHSVSRATMYALRRVENVELRLWGGGPPRMTSSPTARINPLA